MKKEIIHGTPQKLRDLWRERFNSMLRRMSTGAAQIARVITSAHKDQWRRNNKIQKTHHQKPNQHK